MLLGAVRLVPFFFNSPYENMAIDEYLISFYEKTRVPVLRLYSWRPAGISAGKNQDVRLDINLEKCAREGVPVVRRLTGGGAIYHKNELTYSVACSEKDLSEKPLSVKESFEKLNGFIIKMYGKFGLKAAFAKDFYPAGARLGLRSAFCFAASEEYDIIIKGKKIGGNAQTRKKEIIFQHGSIPLEINREAPSYFNTPVNQGNFTGLNELLGRDAEVEEAAANMIAAFTETFNTDLKVEPLGMDEKKEIVGLLTSKYATNDWNLESKKNI